MTAIQAPIMAAGTERLIVWTIDVIATKRSASRIPPRFSDYREAKVAQQ